MVEIGTKTSETSILPYKIKECKECTCSHFDQQQLLPPLYALKSGTFAPNSIALQRMKSLYELMYATFSDAAPSDFREDVIRSQIELITYQMCEFIAINDTESKVSATKSSRADGYFRRFIKELSEHYLERQSVSFYADRLCISSRYLTTIVRRISGYSVLEWMNRYIVTEAKYLLKDSDLSIQKIAYQLSFPNQSFFGKYFKQHTGISPSAYRQGY